jgi:uncharacterized membrane protein
MALWRLLQILYASWVEHNEYYYMNSIRIIIFVCSCVGLLDTMYLIYTRIKGIEVACWWFPARECHKVQHSRYSTYIAHIPNSFFGFGVYATICALTVFAWYSMSGVWIIYGLVSAGWLFSMFLLYVQESLLKVYCTWCVILTVNLTVMLIVMTLYCLQ